MSGVMKMGNIRPTPKVAFEPTYLASQASLQTVTSPRAPDILTLSMPV